jgi:hypothetical protein
MEENSQEKKIVKEWKLQQLCPFFQQFIFFTLWKKNSRSICFTDFFVTLSGESFFRHAHVPKTKDWIEFYLETKTEVIHRS